MMRKFLLFGGLIAMSFSAQALKTQDFVTVIDGQVSLDSIMADTEGRVFAEFTKDTHVILAESKEKYEGTILPPETIELVEKTPRARMKEIVSFELIGQIPGTLRFINQLEMMPLKERRRYQYHNPDHEEYTPVTIYIPLKEEFKHVGLWQYNSNEEEWKRVGGKLSPSEQDDTQVFSTILKGTGAFTLFNENPEPTGVDPHTPDAFEPAEESPFPSVQQDEELSEEDLDSELLLEDEDEDTEMIPSLEEAPPEIDAIDDAASFAPSAPEEIPATDEPDVFYEDDSTPLLGVDTEVPSVTSEMPTDAQEAEPAATPPTETSQAPQAPKSTPLPKGDLPRSGRTEMKSHTLWVFLGTISIVGFAAFYRRKDELEI